MLISAGKDAKITIHSSVKGKIEFLRQINLPVSGIATSIDFMDDKILVGTETGRIITCNV